MMHGKIAIVTGSTRGIGLAIARALLEAGATVVVSGRGQEKVDETVAALSNFGNVKGVAADVAKSAEAQKLIDETVAAFGQVDVLVNNAGITRDNLLMRMKEEEWDAVIETNLKGVYNCIRSAVKPMMKKRDGVIINITSVVGQTGNAGQVNYAASKAGIIGLTKSVAKELASRNIRVNAIAPGFIETDMTGILAENVKEELKKSIPLGRLGQGEDIAALTVFLASDKATYITGQTFNVDGGMVMQ
jgi:3-oxoacyl-[acyl-carrier protein] reductase